MSKVLITADLHMKPYARYAKTENSRLEQFIKLSDLMRETCINHSVEAVIIAGDLLDELAPQPVTYHYLHRFLGNLAAVAPVYIISGNHDMSKNVFDKQNAYYPVLRGSNFANNVEYLHDEFRTVGGKQFYFRGWEPVLRPFPDTDVLITHVYVSGATLPSGLKIKDSEGIKGRYRLVFAGDIHKHQVLRNPDGSQVICIGVPFQNSFSDDPNTGIILLETDTLEWIQISTKNNPNFLRFRYDDTADDIREELYTATDYTDDGHFSHEVLNTDRLFDAHNIIYRQREVKGTAKPFNIKSVGSIDISGILDELIKDFAYKDELMACLGQGSRALESFIHDELKAALKNIEVTNFKSIEKLNLDFTALKKLAIITGQNGVGKSTLLQAVIWALTGKSPADADDVIQSGKPYCEVKLNVEYGRYIYSIERSRGSKFELVVKYVCTTDSPDTRQTEYLHGSSKADLQERLEERLPIIKKLHLLYLNQSRDGFLSELNDAARVSLMSELSGQSVVAEMSDKVDKLVATLKTGSESEDAKYNDLCNRLSALKAQYDENLEDPTAEIKAANAEIATLDAEIETLSKRKAEIADEKRRAFEAVEGGIRAKIREAEAKRNERAAERNEICKDISAYENIANKKLSWTCHVCKTVIKASDITEKAIEDAKTALVALRAELAEIDGKIQKCCDAVTLGNRKLDAERGKMQSGIAEASKDCDLEIDKKAVCRTACRAVLAAQTERLGWYKKNTALKNAITELEPELRRQAELRDASKEKFAAFKKLNSTVFGDDGLMSAAILERIATAINNDPEVKILTAKKLKNGKSRPTLDLELKVNEVFQPYTRMSGGERLRVDLWFLNKMVGLISGMGFLLCDESLKYADPVNAEKMLQSLLDADIKNTLLTYHGTVPPVVLEHPDVSFMSVSKDNGTSVYTVS
jgi:DNA repair exonuclease SbcCD ATPase subunit/DNA repair exonuclease SbcCD nuclease subunit